MKNNIENRDYYRTLSLNLKYYRFLARATQEEIAIKAGISTKFLSMIETDSFKHSPSLETVFNLAEALNVPVKNLFKEFITIDL